MEFFRKKKSAPESKPAAAGANDNPPVPRPEASSGASGGLRHKFNAAVRGMRSLTLRDLSGTAIATIKDLRKPREMGLLVVALIVPGGTVSWCVYRLQKFKSAQTPANDTDIKALPPAAASPESAAPHAGLPGSVRHAKKKNGPAGPR